MAEAIEVKPTATLFGTLVKFSMQSVGSKVIMAITGIGLWLFVTVHMLGNLTIYGGRQAFNGYVEILEENPGLVWAVRVLLLIGFPLHIFTAIRTVALNRAARPVKYHYANKTPARMAAKSMFLTALVVLSFLGYHLAHFTWRITGPQPGILLPNGHVDVYAMVVLGFRQPLIAGFYILAQFMLAAHLSHGLYSMCQHLGLWGPRWTGWLRKMALVVGYGLCLGFISIPLSVFLGIIPL